MTSSTEAAEEHTSPVPFLKWAGGKRWLAGEVKELIPDLDSGAGTYFEPFLGSGAVYFSLRPQRAVLNDLNRDLMNVYRAIKRDPNAVERLLRKYHTEHSPEFYYRMRAISPRTGIHAAARFLYLNRTCWNGLYRVNLQGEFNVPIGTKTSVVLPTDDFVQISRQLRGAALHSMDFARIIKTAKRGDVVFCDPPYTVNHNLNGFLKYNEQLFSWEDQKRLHHSVLAAAKRGVRVIVSNADHISIRRLYNEDLFSLRAVARFSKLSGPPKGRKSITEVLITSGGR